MSNRRRRLVIHIGWPRTGTTFLQSFFLNHRTTLLERGVLYPRGGLQHQGHHVWTCGLIDAHPDCIRIEEWEGVKEALDQELQDESIRSIFISSEALCGIDDIETLKARLKEWDFDITIFAVLREHLEAINSMFNRQLATRAIRFDPRAFVCRDRLVRKYSYSARLSDWADHFGAESIRVVPFESIKSGDTTFISELLESNVDDLLNSEATRDLERNPSLSPTGLVLLQKWPEGNRLIGGKYAMLRKEIAKHGGGKGGFTLFDESLQQHILETFEDDKRELKRKFGVDLPAGKIREPVPFVANVDELINTIYHMWEEFGNWKR